MSSSIDWNDNLMNSMMFLYKTRRCPRDKTNDCPHGDNCFDAHGNDSNTHRRRPFIGSHHGRSGWNYNVTKCTVGYPEMGSKCPKRNRCPKYHSSTELRYHPKEYKTQPCSNIAYKKKGICSNGPKCWWYHSQRDQRMTKKIFIPRGLQGTGLTDRSPPPEQYLHWLNSTSQSGGGGEPMRQMNPQTQQRRPNPIPNPPQPAYHPPRQEPVYHPPAPNLPRKKPPAQPAQPPHYAPHAQPTIPPKPQNNQHNPPNAFDNEMKRNAPPQPAPPVRNNDEEEKKHVAAEPMKRSKELQIKHEEWRRSMTKWYCIFKTKPCKKEDACPKGINCMDYHDKIDRRRVLATGYKALACPKVYDYLSESTPNFRYDLTCPRGDSCEFAHNHYELWYHTEAYKVKPCCFYQVTSQYLEKKAECPFLRDRSWFEQMMSSNPIKKVKDNMVKHSDGRHTCLDYCAFYHTEVDRRYRDDPQIQYNANRGSGVMENDASISQCSSAPPQDHAPQVQIPPMQPQRRPVSPAPHYNKPREPPHYRPPNNNQNNQNNANMPPIPPIPPHVQHGMQSNNIGNAQQNMTDTEKQAQQTEQEEFAAENNDWGF
eukprot:661383_1